MVGIGYRPAQSEVELIVDRLVHCLAAERVELGEQGQRAFLYAAVNNHRFVSNSEKALVDEYGLNLLCERVFLSRILNSPRQDTVDSKHERSDNWSI